MFKRISQWIDAFLSWLTRAITEPRSELTRWEQAARFTYDLGRHGARQLRQDRAPQMAAALAYRTLFGLLPVLVVATVVARAVMGPTEFLDLAQRVIVSLGLSDIQFSQAIGQASDVVQGPPLIADVSLGEWVSSLVGRAININLAAIGWIGLLVVLYSAIGLVVTVERCFNTICRAPEGRPWMMRVLLYWFVLTVSPIAIGLTFWFDNRMDGWIEAIGAWQWLLTSLNVVWSLIVMWLLMTIVYQVVPNTPVSLRASIVGALVSAVLLLGLSRLFGVYLDRAVSFTQLYGSLGLIPLFMFWVYLMWLVVLFGLEVASILHSLRGRRLEELKEKKPATGLVDPAAVVSIMEVAAGAFAQGRALTALEAAQATRLAEPIVSEILLRLHERGVVHEVSRPEGAYTLARPPEEISAAHLLRIGFDLADEGAARDRPTLFDRLREAQIKAAEGATLAGVALPSQ